jgi:hypothetical protein
MVGEIEVHAARDLARSALGRRSLLRLSAPEIFERLLVH